MKHKIKNVFNNIKNYLNKDLVDKRWKWFVRFFLILIISIYIGALCVISVVGMDYVNEKLEQVETKLELIDKPINYANSSNNNVISPTGTYDYIYFNTSSQDFSYLNSLNFVDIGIPNVENVYFVYFANNESNDNLTILKFLVNDNNYFFNIANPFTNIVYFTISFTDGNWSVEDNILINNILEVSFNNGLIDADGTPIGQQNNLLTNLISPVPFLFEGTNTQDMESSGINTTTIDDFYINTTLTNVTMKEILDSNLGTTNGTSFDISVPFMDSTNTEYYNNYRVNIINTSTSAFIRLENTDGTLVEYWYIYDTLDTADSVYWYGINPDLIDINGRVFSSSSLDNSINISYDGTLETALNFLFSDSNDFTIIEITPPTYEEGYNDGVQQVIDNPNDYGLYTQNQYNNAFNDGVQQVIDNPNEYDLYDSEYVDTQYDEGFNYGRDTGVTIGRDEVIDNPNRYGLYTQEQYDDALAIGGGDITSPVFRWLTHASRVVDNVLSVEIMPNVTIGLLVFFPIIIGLLFFILKVFFGG